MSTLISKGLKIFAATMLALLAPTGLVAESGAVPSGPSPSVKGPTAVGARTSLRPVELVEEQPQTFVVSEDVKIFGLRLLALLALVGLAAGSVATSLRWSPAEDRPAPVAKSSRLPARHIEGKPHTRFVPEDVRKVWTIRESSTE